MINRVLIRIKVVQMLYSYLLTQSEFRIINDPVGESRDQRYAHRLYLDTLLLILELSGWEANPRRLSPLTVVNPLHESKMARSLHSNPDLRTVMLRADNGISDFDQAIEPLLKAITTSAAYRSYVRIKDRDIPEDVKFWITVVRTIIARSPEFEEAARRCPEFTLAGMSRALEMVEETLGSCGDTRRLFKEASVSLGKSLDKAYELYHALLLLPLELTHLQDQRLDAAKHKYLPTDEDLNPSMRFVDNKFVEALSANAALEEYISENPFSWDSDHVMLKNLLDSVIASDIYRDYMSAPTEPTFADDAELWRKLFKSVILPSDDLAEALESRSVYWNDDLDIMGTFVIKTIKRFASSDNGNADLLPKYKDSEDEVFGPNLFVSAVRNRDMCRDLIDRFINEAAWDSDRLAFMDIVIMTAAITELLDYPAIPIPVTLNEYIEIANAYSTPRSGAFINGILYSVINHLRQEGRLIKK